MPWQQHFELTIELGNEAMESRDDVSRALVALAERLTHTLSYQGIVKDENGNTVGHWEFTQAAYNEEPKETP